MLIRFIEMPLLGKGHFHIFHEKRKISNGKFKVELRVILHYVEKGCKILPIP